MVIVSHTMVFSHGKLWGGRWVSVWWYSWRAFRSAILTSFDRRVALAAFLGATCFFLTSVTEASFAAESVRQMLMFVWAAGLGMYLKSKSGLAPQ